LESSDGYVQLKIVPAEMKLPREMTPVTEEYTQKRVTAVCKELRNCQHFKQAITEFLWSPQIQSQARCSMYQDRWNKGREKICEYFTIHNDGGRSDIKTSMMEDIGAICGHYPNYV
jgi:hypothetical protein